MAKQHEFHSALTQAFESADRLTPRTKAGNGSYGFASTGMPISPAREASVKKAASVSAANRGAKAAIGKMTKLAPVAPAIAPAPTLGTAAVTSHGGLALAKPKKNFLGGI